MEPITRDYAEAVRILDRKGHGTIRMKDGIIVKGTLYDIQSPLDDSEGIGYVSIDEADALLEAW